MERNEKSATRLVEMNLTAPLAHRHPFWMGLDLIRTSDLPLSYIDYLNDWILYVHLKTLLPISTAIFVIEEKNDLFN